MTPYEELKVAQAKAADARRRIDKCDHNWSQDDAYLSTYIPEIRDAMSGMNYDGDPIYAQRQNRRCVRCGLTMQRVSFMPNVWQPWKETP